MSRARSGARRADSLRSGFHASSLAVASTLALVQPAAANDLALSVTPALYWQALLSLNQSEAAALALVLGVIFFAVMTAIMLVRTRIAASQREAELRGQIMTLTAEVDRVNALLLSEPQVIVAWAAAAEEPEIVGDIGIIAQASAPRRVLAFGSWLDAEQAQAMDHAVEALRTRGEPFSLALTTLAGAPIEAEGRAIGGRAVLRLRPVQGIHRELAALQESYRILRKDLGALQSLMDAFPIPVWARDAEGRLDFVNAAYANAVEAVDPTEAVERGLELLDRAARDNLARMRAAGAAFRERVPAIVAGARRIFDIREIPTQRGSAGLAIDVTEVETARAELRRMADAHRRTLDQLATGVAIFGADQKLTFCNAAYRSLWDLDPAFLDDGPTDSAVLERLRAARKLPEEQDFRQWKNQLHEAYRSLEAREAMWHLPDGRTLRVVTTPNPQGGVTYLFDDVTEKLDLARRYDALIRVQGETLDNLAEAVAVFASDGRLRLYNPAFARMWKLAPEALAERPHIEAVIAWCTPLQAEDATIRKLRTTVTSIGQREPVTGRLERRDGSVIDCATLPLPDGATLITFQDVTDTVHVERALRERNEALMKADQIKIDFLHHVSYELRSPLTNIIGFAHFLGDPATGPLNPKQAEYLGYIIGSTDALMAIINDILDLATIDAGAMTLNLGPVDIRRTMEAAAEGVRDRLVSGDIRLDLQVAPDIGSFIADERRVRQILFNLLSNAVGFSPEGQAVTLRAEKREGAIVFSVTDHGPGIPPDMKNRIFDRFESHSLGSRHRGAGLGLSIVRSFVQLHGGTVAVDSTVGRGTTVTCTFPLDHSAKRTAA
ncbi:MAG TPA: PAS-domain containing protein [Pseudorhodoplanes sp.]|nr:PAS-domain containing protein [Pseudorhodoplanes sp.]